MNTAWMKWIAGVLVASAAAFFIGRATGGGDGSPGAEDGEHTHTGCSP